MIRQFDICRIAPADAGAATLVLVMQHDELSRFSTRIVVPLIAITPSLELDRTTVMVRVDDRRYAAVFHLMATVSIRELSDPVTNIEFDERPLKNAIDMIFFGI